MTRGTRVLLALALLLTIVASVLIVHGAEMIAATRIERASEAHRIIVKICETNKRQDAGGAQEAKNSAAVDRKYSQLGDTQMFRAYLSERVALRVALEKRYNDLADVDCSRLVDLEGLK